MLITQITDSKPRQGFLADDEMPKKEILVDKGSDALSVESPGTHFLVSNLPLLLCRLWGWLTGKPSRGPG
eukprot:scaffold15648_cov27-Prasinocladus_malaysianus.AAC.1